VNSFAANVANGVSYTNAGNLLVLSINIIGYGGATGVSSSAGPIDVGTINGTLDINQPVNASGSTAALSAGSAAGTDNALTLNNSVSGTAGVTLSGDNMDLTNGSAAVNAGTTVTILKPFDPA